MEHFQLYGESRINELNRIKSGYFSLPFWNMSFLCLWCTKNRIKGINFKEKQIVQNSQYKFTYHNYDNTVFKEEWRTDFRDDDDGRSGLWFLHQDPVAIINCSISFVLGQIGIWSQFLPLLEFYMLLFLLSISEFFRSVFILHFVWTIIECVVYDHVTLSQMQKGIIKSI